MGEGGVRVEAVRVEGGVPPLWRPSDGRVNPPIITTGNYNFSFCLRISIRESMNSYEGVP